MSPNDRLPRYIVASNIEIGDLIRVQWKEGGITHTRTARVAKREYDGNVRVLSNLEGHEILRYVPGVKEHKITLIDKTAPIPEPLFNLLDGIAI